MHAVKTAFFINIDLFLLIVYLFKETITRERERDGEREIGGEKEREGGWKRRMNAPCAWVGDRMIKIGVFIYVK